MGDFDLLSTLLSLVIGECVFLLAALDVTVFVLDTLYLVLIGLMLALLELIYGY
jgi:hypothetical protein